MNKRIYTYILAAILAAVSVINADSQTVSAVSHNTNASKADADSLYKAEKYTEAAAIYEALVAKKGESADIFYNLGNCYYKLNNIAPAILNYERALLLDGTDKQIKDNLTLARSKTIDKIPAPSEMFFVTWWKNLSNAMTVDAWGCTALALFIICLLAAGVYMFAQSIPLRKAGLYISLSMLILCLASNFAGKTRKNTLSTHDYAIIISSAVSVKSSPSSGSTDLFIIHEGTKVKILDSSIKGWKEVSYEEGKTGWIPTENIEII